MGGGAEAGGQMVDQRFVATIDEKGESRFFMAGLDLYNVEHYLYIGGVSGETKTTVYAADAPEYAATRKKLEEGVPDYMKCLGLASLASWKPAAQQQPMSSPRTSSGVRKCATTSVPLRSRLSTPGKSDRVCRRGG